jgi:hypothetical protein
MGTMKKKTFTRFKFLTLLGLLASFAAHADVVAYFANGEEGRRLEFGSGRDGAFSDGPTQTGITVAGANITVDTSVKSIYEFTSFALTAGHTLTATGSSPLIIRVRGSSTIAGTLRLDGATGTAATAGAPGAGGAAGAGGGSGGLGGKLPPSSVDGAAGLPTAGNSIGGKGGINDAALSGQREGGGGCNGPGATDGQNFPGSAASCPYTAAIVASGFESAFFLSHANQLPGGGGGGGGGTRDLAGNNMNGAGGGGGGGAFVLTSTGDLVLSGTISANGGAGGAGLLGVGDYGASGGGGSGGSLWFQSAGGISGAGTIAVSGGVGGQDPLVGSIGGNGSRGSVRMDAATPAFTGSVTGGSVDRTFVVYPATIEFKIGAGPACGTLVSPGTSSGEGLAVFWLNLLFAVFLYRLVRIRFSRRRASSSHF